MTATRVFEARTCWDGKGRLVIFLLASTSILCLLADFYGLWSMRLATGFIFIPAVILLGTICVVDSLWGDHRGWHCILIGIVAGLSAAVAYDLFRLPFVFSKEWGLDSVVPPMNLFKVFPRFGAMILGQAIEQPRYSAMTQIVGWIYHFSNGATFGVMYLAIIGDGARRHWAWGIPFAVALELGMLFTPYSTVFNIPVTTRFAVVTMAAHAIFGFCLGLSVRRLSLRIRPDLPLSEGVMWNGQSFRIFLGGVLFVLSWSAGEGSTVDAANEADEPLPFRTTSASQQQLPKPATAIANFFEPIERPLRASRNPNYFEDASGHPVILCGSQTWNTLQDWGSGGTVRPLDFDAFVGFLRTHGHNFTLLWCTELPKFSNLPVTTSHPPDFTVSPHPWMRTGPGRATDGGLKFDLTKFDAGYFDRLRSRVMALNRAGIYAGVYLFTAEWLLRFRSATDGYPFSGPNNVNDVDDGYRGGPAESGLSSVTMTATNIITDVQDEYVKRTIDTLNDLPNVLWMVSEEAPRKSTWWNSHLISLVKNYERGKPNQHPVGYAALDSPPDSILYNSEADWVAPSAWVSPATSCGTGKPACKVNINDSDHSYFGMWNDTPQKNRNYAWQNFLNGNQVLFMDPYLVYYPRENRNSCPFQVNGIGTHVDSRWDNFRNNLGYLLRYSRKLNLANVAPRGSLSSTKYCLAQTPPTGAEYLVYAPAGGPFTVDLSAMPNSRKIAIEWFNPAVGLATTESAIPAGSGSQVFNPPFSGDAVLSLVDAEGHK